MPLRRSTPDQQSPSLKASSRNAFLLLLAIGLGVLQAPAWATTIVPLALYSSGQLSHTRIPGLQRPARTAALTQPKAVDKAISPASLTIS
jgi:hypothetical protein